MAHEELITDAPRVGRGSRALMLGNLALVAALLVGTGLNDRLRAPKRVQLIGQEAAAEQAAAAKRSLWDGSWAHWVDTRLRTRSRTRREVGPYWAALLFKAGDVKGRSLVVGRDRWLFLRRRVELPAPVREESPVTTANVMAALGRRLESSGVRLIVTPLPRKAVACADMLPAGVDPGASFDRDVVERLRANGLVTADLVDEWVAAPPAERFMRFDTHWSRGGMLSLVKAIDRLAPGLRRDPEGAWLQPAEERAWQDLLDVVGLNHNYRASSMFDGRLQQNVIIGPAAARSRLRPEERWGELVVSGTSYTAANMFGELCGGLLGASTTVISERGLPPLSAIPGTFDRLGPMPAGTTFVVELPTVLVDSFGGISRVLDDAVARLCLEYAPAAVDEIDPARLRAHAELPDPAVGRSRFRFHRSSLLSSGTGVMLLRFEVGGESATRWELRSSGARLRFDVLPGAPVVLPLIEGHRWTGVVNVVPLDEAAVTAELSITPVMERADVRDLSVVGTVVSAATPVAFGDAVELAWERHEGDVAVVMEGVDRSGVARTERIVFPAPNARVALLDAGAFAGGRLESVRLEGAQGAIVARYRAALGND